VESVRVNDRELQHTEVNIIYGCHQDCVMILPRVSHPMVGACIRLVWGQKQLTVSQGDPLTDVSALRSQLCGKFWVRISSDLGITARMPDTQSMLLGQLVQGLRHM
jgi:hypothetical protein